jgi:8-amino-7-oxononanoate synthase
MAAGYKQDSVAVDASEAKSVQVARTQSNTITQSSIEAWLLNRLSEAQDGDVQIDINAPISDYALDSLELVIIVGELEEWLGLSLDANILLACNTIAELCAMVAVSVGAAPQPVPSSSATTIASPDTLQPEIPVEFYRFETYPEYLALRRRIDEANQEGFGDPFFRVHTGITGDTAVINGSNMINYSTYNYLDLSGDARVSAAAKAAIDTYGTSVSASRIVSGEKPIHHQLERAIAQFLGVADAVVFVGGHATNVSTIGYLFGPKDLILHDPFTHNSAIEGVKLSGAKVKLFPHNDWQAVDRILETHRHNYERVLILLEGVYSTDGAIPDLPHFLEVKTRHKAWLMIDEAHSLGTIGKTGRGICEYFGVDPNEVDILMGTLSKSMASCGGYIAGNHALIEYLKYLSPGFIFSVGMTPPNAAAALAALQILQKEPERIAQLQDRARFFLRAVQKHNLNIGLSKNDSPVIPVIVGDSLKAIQLSQLLLRRNINVQPMLYPSVSNTEARLRFFMSCQHTDAQIEQTLAILLEEMANLKLLTPS